MKELLKRLMGHSGFSDSRSMKVILVPHCVPNQNSRAAGAAEFPSAVEPLISGLMDRRIGIIQMPCPEMRIAGLRRGNVRNIRAEMEKPENRAQCARIAQEVIGLIEDYQECGITVLGVLGKNGSPTCGVEKTWFDGVAPGSGVFIEQLELELNRRRTSVRLAGVQDSDPLAALKIVDCWMRTASAR